MSKENKKIMVVDDDMGILEVIKIILEDSGYNVKTVDDGEKVMKEVNQDKPDLILLDIWMPGMNGEEVCKQIKNNKETENIPVIMLSASIYTEKISKESKANGYLAKPFDMDELLGVVSRSLA